MEASSNITTCSECCRSQTVQANICVFAQEYAGLVYTQPWARLGLGRRTCLLKKLLVENSGPISCPATSATKHMCVRSPHQWANQMGAKAEDMKPVIKSRVSHGWRCGEARTEQYGRRLKRQRSRRGSVPSCVCGTGVSLPLSCFLLSWHVRVCFHALLYLCLGFLFPSILTYTHSSLFPDQETNLIGDVNTFLWVLCSCTITLWTVEIQIQTEPSRLLKLDLTVINVLHSVATVPISRGRTRSPVVFLSLLWPIAAAAVPIYHTRHSPPFFPSLFVSSSLCPPV